MEVILGYVIDSECGDVVAIDCPVEPPRGHTGILQRDAESQSLSQRVRACAIMFELSLLH